MSTINIEVEASLLTGYTGIEVLQGGMQGARGPQGIGIPLGGTEGEVLTKLTDADLDTVWAPPGSVDYRRLTFWADSDGPFEGFPGGYKETVLLSNPNPPLASSVTWYTDSSKTTKMMEQLFTYNPNFTPDTITYRVYASDGATVVTQAVDTIQYSGVFEINSTRSVT